MDLHGTLCNGIKYCLTGYIYGIVWQGRAPDNLSFVTHIVYMVYVVSYRLLVNMAQPGLLTVSSSRSRCLQIVLPGAKDLQGCSCISFARNDI